MDWFFNLQIPKSTPTTLIIRPASKTFVTGIAMRYDPSYHREHKLLRENLEFDEYTYMVNCLNDTLKQYWPCNCMIYTGYFLSPFTLGLSFMLPNLCIADAKDAFIKAIAR